jgi:hypothetical protein
MTVQARQTPGLDTLDATSRRLLPVLRHLLGSVQDNAHAGWQTAYAVSVEVWGEARGLAIAYRAQKFLAALLRSRAAPLGYSDPLCPDARRSLTGDEWCLLALLSHMKADDTPRARDMLATLTRGRVEAMVVRAALELCGALDGRATRSAGGPKLALVR